MATPAQAQFVEDYLLVTDNDFAGYTAHMNHAKSGDMVTTSGKIQEEFESYISDVVEREKEQGNTTGALLISQLLLGWGSDTFDQIARHYMDKE
jgi:hypothetical protein